MTRDNYLAELSKSYSLVSVLSTNNNCKVLRMRNKANGRDIVVRSMSEGVAAYGFLYRIKHKNLPAVYDVINLADGQIVFEEYIDGLTIAQIMETGPYRKGGAQKVAKEICHALYLLHLNGIVHRDIKPENVMVDNNGRVVLIDFNASRQVSNAGKDTVIMGTIGYASPEQLGISQSDARTDIYAMGVLLNVMVTGKHPSERIARGRVGKIVRKCTNVNPSDRYQSAKKLYEAL